jgi:hypothetical protein
VIELLEQQSLDSITLDSTQGARGQPLTSLTVVVRPEDGDTVAAALLQVCWGWGLCALGWGGRACEGV